MIDFIINFAYSFGGVMGGWLVTHFYYKKNKEEQHEQKIKDKLESLCEEIRYAYRSKGNKRKSKLQDISFISVKIQRKLLGSLVMDLQDILYKNLDSKEQTISEVLQIFKKHYPKYFG
ncbi:hypothetical protein MJ480_001026 [Campylobacter coli]|nr:hypothetical protein [Campylobacter coli]EAI2541503.1 hypothetical protein [Campylobacter jejuni]EAH8507211.1 hypothetical protein [Campylobacter coli]EAH9176660.1 hypothetical protein [Campylobacter coli]EAI0021398.1 hypothetical protein [Campylobacter coli]